MEQTGDFDKGAKQINVVLVGFSSEDVESIKMALNKLGWNFRMILCEEENVAIQQLLSEEHEYFLINGDYLKDHPKVDKLVSYLPMKKRRNQILILVDKHLHTLDKFAAFRRNVNGVINFRDLSYLSDFIPKIIDNHKSLYRGYQKMLKELEIL